MEIGRFEIINVNWPSNIFRKCFFRATVLFLFLAAVRSFAGLGALDLSFDPASGINGDISCVLPLSDGKIIIEGGFSTVRGAARNQLARLNADGSVDMTFDARLAFNDSVQAIALQPDGKLLVAKNLVNIIGFPTNAADIVRLNSDGSLDDSFNAEIVGQGIIYSILVQPDGNILVGGTFTNINGSSFNRIARLNADGNLDDSFNPGTGANDAVYGLTLRPDGGILVAGQFTSINGTNRNEIARLNSDGSLDSTFDPGTGPGGLLPSVRATTIQSDDKILLAGIFTSIDGTNQSGIARLNPDGSPDFSFNSPIAQNEGIGMNSDVESIALQTNGKILIGGDFDIGDATNRACIALLNADGSLDDTFDADIAGTVFFVTLQTNGMVLAGGSFSTVNGIEQDDLARLNPDGTSDESFDPGISSVVPSNVADVTLQPDGKVLLGIGRSGIDYSRGWPYSNTIVRLNTNGVLDSTFQIGAGLDEQINSVVVQTNNGILIGGDFTMVNDTNRNHIARLNAGGGLDLTFDPGSGANSSVWAIVLQPDGKVILGGAFTVINGTNRNYIARLNDDGSLDDSFDPGIGANASIFCVALEPDGKIIVGGDFTNVNGMTRNRIARLNSDGSVDDTFDAGKGPDFRIYSITIQTDGKVLIGGDFDTVNGKNRLYLARLNADGTLDDTFNPGFWAVNTYPLRSDVYSIALQWDGKILVGGNFFITNSITARHIAQFNADGNLDRTFIPDLIAGPVDSIAVQPDGRILIGGEFGNISAVPRSDVARLWGDGAMLNSEPMNTNGDFVARFTGIPGLVYTIESADNLSPPDWQKFINVTAPTNDTGLGIGVFEVNDPIQVSGKRFYRVVYPSY